MSEQLAMALQCAGAIATLITAAWALKHWR